MKSLMLTLLAASLALIAQGPVPRQAPELKIVESSGRITMLSSLRGRVVLMAFISTQCGHCQRASHVFEQLSHEYAGKVQVAEVAFDENADTAAFVKKFGLTFPVGTDSADAVRAFLGITRGELLGTPQVLAIDRRGTIRVQSQRLGSPALQTPDVLRDVIKALLGEVR